MTTLTEKRSSGDTIPGWSLTAADHPSPGISLIGFDLDQVRAACVQHDWRFE